MLGIIILALAYSWPLFLISSLASADKKEIRRPLESDIMIHNYRLKPRYQQYYRDLSLVEIREVREAKEKLLWFLNECKHKNSR